MTPSPVGRERKFSLIDASVSGMDSPHPLPALDERRHSADAAGFGMPSVMALLVVYAGYATALFLLGRSLVDLL